MPEIAPVEISIKGQKKIVSKDEEFSKVKIESLAGLRGAFGGAGTVTAGNSSTISDGASSVVLSSYKNCLQANLKPLFRIVSWADAATVCDPNIILLTSKIFAKKKERFF